MQSGYNRLNTGGIFSLMTSLGKFQLKVHYSLLLKAVPRFPPRGVVVVFPISISYHFLCEILKKLSTEKVYMYLYVLILQDHSSLLEKSGSLLRDYTLPLTYTPPAAAIAETTTNT